MVIVPKNVRLRNWRISPGKVAGEGHKIFGK